LILDKMSEQLTRAADGEVRIIENPIFSRLSIMPNHIGDLLNGVVNLDLAESGAGSSFAAGMDRGLHTVAKERFFPKDTDDYLRGMMHIGRCDSTNKAHHFQKGYGLVLFPKERDGHACAPFSSRRIPGSSA
jgi:hypothetical protein